MHVYPVAFLVQERAAMKSQKAYLRSRTPKACEKCRRTKTKCNGERPQCRNCLRRNVTCLWSSLVGSETSHMLTSPREDETLGIIASQARVRSYQAVSEVPSSIKTPLILPESQPLERLCHMFFSRHHDAELCSFFHKPSLDLPTLRDRSPFLVASVLSLGALYLPANEAKADFGFETPVAVSDHYARLAKYYIYIVSDEPSTYAIQAYLILSMRELLTWSNIKAYMYAGTALRMAQALYLNVEITSCFSPQQKEVRRRTFWACFVVDRLISYSFNKPLAMSILLARVQLPCPENVFAFNEGYTGQTIEDISSHANQVSHLGVMPFFIAMVRLWGDMAILHVSGGRRRSKHGPHSSESEFHRCQKGIEDFSSSLHASLSWSIQNLKIHQVTRQEQAYINLNFLLHHSKCVMHQEYLPQLDSQYSFNSEVDDANTFDAAGISLDYADSNIIKTCTSSVNVITHMALTLNAGSNKDRELLQSIFAANAILTASAVHLWVLYTQSCDECPKHIALANAEKLRQIIKSWQPQWRVATAWVETLEMLYKLYVYSYGKIVESDLDCWDMGTDDLSNISERAMDAPDESNGHPMTPTLDGLPDPSTVCQRLYDKIRSILVNPLLATDVKKRNLRIYSRTLWQHMWSFGPIEGDGDGFLSLESIMGETGAEHLNMQPFDTDLGGI